MIKLKEILHEVEGFIPQYLYHATFRPLLRSILEQGIVPGGTNVRNYDWPDPNYVYLSYSRGEAESFAENSDNESIPEEWLEDIIILTIDTSKLDIQKIRKDENYNPSLFDGEEEEGKVFSFMYDGTVPKEAIVEYD